MPVDRPQSREEMAKRATALNMAVLNGEDLFCHLEDTIVNFGRLNYWIRQ